ncbi:Hypothetical predicted protein [Cloeon dipterum]|uniref:Uncharacterized protein n=1 Tax=Cloeon dipterum TaxID=197152 RepID=A0A8S1CUG1_9INSE|nr:Hypothetical predicted protein [Cloeon dipterum]CAB3371518.1 Hypothetical predicted protein [Cloeon dipterum]
MVNLGMKVVGVSRKVIGTAKWKDVSSKEGHTGEMVYMQGDVTHPLEIKRILNWTRTEFGRTDVLVNAAGFYHNVNPCDAATYIQMYVYNVAATFMFSRAVVAEMIDNHTTNGHIITISSLVGKKNMGPISKESIVILESVRQVTVSLEDDVRTSLLPITVTNIKPPHWFVATSKPEDYIPIRDVTAEDIAKEICRAVSIDHPLTQYL